MKFCVAQSRPVFGEVDQNVESHLKLVELAVENGCDLIVFPELSITGYEPTLAKRLAMAVDDRRLDGFQAVADKDGISICVGIPGRQQNGTCISSAILAPNSPRRLYSKEYIHSSEEPFFVAGDRFGALIDQENRCALAICYELSVPEHAEEASRLGAQIYIASVAHTAEGDQKTRKRLAEIARKYRMIVATANSVGTSGGYDCIGKSAVWNRDGEITAELDDTNEGIIVVETITMESMVRQSN